MIAKGNESLQLLFSSVFDMKERLHHISLEDCGLIC